MLVLGISGSPKLKGFTNLLLDSALEGASISGAHTEKIILNDLAFRPCQECGGCDKTGICVLEDDMKGLYDKLLKADSIIVASPIYFGSITAQLKAMIDRLQSLWIAKYVLKNNIVQSMKRKGAFICAAGSEKREYFDNAKSIIKIMFAVLSIEYADELFIAGTNDMSADSSKRKEAIRKSNQLGISISR